MAGRLAGGAGVSQWGEATRKGHAIACPRARPLVTLVKAGVQLRFLSPGLLEALDSIERVRSARTPQPCPGDRAASGDVSSRLSGHN